MVLDIQIWQCPMDVSADFLSLLRGTKDSDDRDLNFDIFFLTIGRNGDLGIELSGRSLVVVNAVEPYTKGVHGR